MSLTFLASGIHLSTGLWSDRQDNGGAGSTARAHMSVRVGEVAGVLSFLIADYFQEAGLPPAIRRERALADTPQTEMALILERAVERGEISPASLSPRIASLAVDLVRHDLIMNQAPVPDVTLVEIVDKIFLPLVRPDTRG
jgi:hypothetical protein